MEDKLNQPLKPVTNKSGCQTEKWQTEGAYWTLVHPALTEADQKATKDPLCEGGAISLAL